MLDSLMATYDHTVNKKRDELCNIYGCQCNTIRGMVIENWWVANYPFIYLSIFLEAFSQYFKLSSCPYRCWPTSCKQETATEFVDFTDADRQQKIDDSCNNIYGNGDNYYLTLVSLGELHTLSVPNIPADMSMVDYGNPRNRKPPPPGK